MINDSPVVQFFNELVAGGVSESAAATLCLAAAIEDLPAKLARSDLHDLLGHEICMGIRHGLYGANADMHSHLSAVFDDASLHVHTHDGDRDG